jgi:glutamate-1-semialdehyde 2,1-aminomutase
MSRYQESEKWLTRAEKSIPLGSQTFSKSRSQYPVGISPLYISNSDGPYVWDIDGHRYIDLVSSLASVTLGYKNRGVNAAVRKQLNSGVTFSLPGKLEAEVAELIQELVPSAELVRFGKNGTDATSAAVRLARAYTGRTKIIVCGYHGWQDWYIGSTSRNKGVPEAVSNLTLKFAYNDIESFRNIVLRDPDIACVVMEPMNSQFPEPGFLEKVRTLTRQLGIVLIFDETITGFRFAPGGAQELFDVTPDLSTFGKGIANGFPLSAVVGKKEIMQEMEHIFFSGTFGGELLSLAAAREVLIKYSKKQVCEQLYEKGAYLNRNIEKLIQDCELTDYLTLSGHPSWTFLNWKEDKQYSVAEIKTYFLQEMFQRGILLLNTHNVNTAMKKKHLKKIVLVYETVLPEIQRNLTQGTLSANLRAKPLQPLFSVR